MTGTADTADTALRTHVTEVVRARQVTPRVRRITFGGGDLAGYVPAGPDQFLYLLLPPPDRRDLTVDAGFSWAGYFALPEPERPVGAYYTVRHHRPERAEIDLDVVLHHPAGPASSWAATAGPGDPAALWGPRSNFAPPSRGVDWYLLVADESGLPATAAILEALPEGAVVRAVVEVPDASEEQPLAGGDDVVVTWLHRGDRPAGTAARLADAVRALEPPGGRASGAYAWGGGESRAMTAVRRYLRDEVGLDRDQVSMTPYWRHPAHAADPVDPEE